MKRFILLSLSLFASILSFGQAQDPSKWQNQDNPDDSNFEFYSQKGGVKRKAKVSDIKKAVESGFYSTPVVNVLPTGNAPILRGKYVKNLGDSTFYVNSDGVSFYVGNATIPTIEEVSTEIIPTNQKNKFIKTIGKKLYFQDNKGKVSHIREPNTYDFDIVPNSIEDISLKLKAMMDAGITEINLPVGNFYASHVDLISNISFKGSKNGKTRLIQMQTSVRYSESDALITINKNNEGSNLGEWSTSKKNIIIADIELVGRVVEDGFNEYMHLVHMHDASNVRFNNVLFTGFQGDGISINRGNQVAQEDFARNSYNIKIEGCIFNGINRNNRNGISLGGCSVVVVDKCTFRNCTRFNMPGPINIEPGWNFQKCDNITVSNCTIDSCGGIGAVLLQVNGSDNGVNQTLRRNFIFSNIVIRNCKDASATETYGFYITNTDNSFTSTNKPINCIIENCHVYQTERMFYVKSVNGVTVVNNQFENISGGGYIQNMKNLNFEKNTFIKTFYNDNRAIDLESGDKIIFEKNTFDSCGIINEFHFVLNGNVNITNIKWIGNVFTKSSSSSNKVVFDALRLTRNLSNLKSFQYISNIDTGFTHLFLAGTYPSLGVCGFDGVYTTMTLPDDYDNGKIVWKTLYDVGLPSSTKSGMVVTEKNYLLASERSYSIIQHAYIDNVTNDIYYRKSNSSNSWTSWIKITTN
jgi:archaellum component FlaG (FlaF/FlaG flagellin family)